MEHKSNIIDAQNIDGSCQNQWSDKYNFVNFVHNTSYNNTKLSGLFSNFSEIIDDKKLAKKLKHNKGFDENIYHKNFNNFEKYYVVHNFFIKQIIHGSVLNENDVNGQSTFKIWYHYHDFANNHNSLIMIIQIDDSYDSMPKKEHDFLADEIITFIKNNNPGHIKLISILSTVNSNQLYDYVSNEIKTANDYFLTQVIVKKNNKDKYYFTERKYSIGTMNTTEIKQIIKKFNDNVIEIKCQGLLKNMHSRTSVINKKNNKKNNKNNNNSGDIQIDVDHIISNASSFYQYEKNQAVAKKKDINEIAHDVIEINNQAALNKNYSEKIMIVFSSMLGIDKGLGWIGIVTYIVFYGIFIYGADFLIAYVMYVVSTPDMDELKKEIVNDLIGILQNGTSIV